MLQGPVTSGRQKMPNPYSSVLPDVRDIFPVRPTAGSQPTGDVAVVKALMNQVEQDPVAWHQHAVLQQQEASA